MKIIAICNQKGGVGKTTSSVNLSAALAASGVRVLLADVDPQGNASSVLGDARATRSVYEAMLDGCPVAELIQPTRIENLALLPAELDMAGAEVEVARMDDHLHQLSRIFDPLRRSGEYDYLFLDCPPSLGIWMLNALAAADEVLVPVQCEYYSLEGLSLLWRVLDNMRRSGANESLAICGLLLTMFDARLRLSAAVADDVRRHMGEVVFETQIPRSVRLGEAPSHRRTIFEHDPHGPAARSYQALAQEFLRRQRAGVAFIAPEALPEVSAA